MYQEKSDFNAKWRKRLLVFIATTGTYLVFAGTYTLIDLFITDIKWDYDPLMYTYCVYAIWFNISNYVYYHRHSVKSEKEQNQELYTMIGIPPFNHKKARREIFWLSFFTVLVNLLLMAATKWLW